MLGVPPERVFEALQVYLGSAFVNDFNLLGRTYRVTAQADAPLPRRPRPTSPTCDALELGRDGAARLGRDLPGPHRPVSRVALQPGFPAVEIDGDTAPGYSSGQSLKTHGEARAETLPPGFATEWTGIAYQQKAAGSTAGHGLRHWPWCSSSWCSPRSSRA